MTARSATLDIGIAPDVGPDDPRRFTDSGIEIQPVYDDGDIADLDLEERLGEPGQYPFTRGIHPEMYRSRRWTMRQYAGYATAQETNLRYRYLLEHGSTGLSMAFDLPTQLGRDSDDPLCLGRGWAHRRRDRLDRRHADGVRPDPARQGLDLDDDQRAGRDPDAALRAGRRGAGRAVRAAARHGPERHPQGVRGPRELHLPARGRDAPDDRHLRLLPQAHPEVEHDLDLRLPHAREGLLGGPGGRVHALERDRLRAGGDRRRPRGRRVRAPDRVLLQRPQQRLPGDREVPCRAEDVGRDHARPLRGQGPALADGPLPHPDRRLHADRPAAREQHHPGRAPGLRRRLRRHAVAPHERLRRGARAADRVLGADRAAHAAGPRARVGRGRHGRSVRGLLLRRAPDGRHREPGPGTDGEGLRARRVGARDRGRVHPARDRGVGLRLPPPDPHQAGRPRRRQRVHRGRRGGRGRHPEDRSADRARQVERLRKFKENRDQELVRKRLEDLRDVARGEGNLLYPIKDALRDHATLGEVCNVMREEFGEYKPPV